MCESVYVCARACLCVNESVFVYVSLCVRVRINVFVSVRAHVCMFLNVCVCARVVLLSLGPCLFTDSDSRQHASMNLCICGCLN